MPITNPFSTGARRPRGCRLAAIVTAAALAASWAGSAVAGSGPSVGPQVRIDVAGGFDAANETTGAVSPTSPNEIVAAWNDWRQSTGSEIINMGVAVSLDGGATWSDFLVRPPAGFQSTVEGDPMTAFDPRTGDLWVGAISFGASALYVARKTPGSTDFEDSVVADVGGGIDKCWMVAGPRPGNPDSTRLYVGYNFGVIQSDDLGQTWTNPISLGGGLGWLPRVGPDGELYLAFWDFSSNTMRLQRRLTDGGSFQEFEIASKMDNWSVETFNTRYPGTYRMPPLVGFAVDPRPVAEGGGTLYAVYADTTSFVGGDANTDVYFTRSTDRGATWTTPVVINGDAAGPFYKGDSLFPWIEVDPTGRLHMVTLDSRHTVQDDNQTDGFLDGYYAWSEDGGDTWTEIRLTPSPWSSDDDGLNRSAQFIGDYLGMGVSETQAFPIYLNATAGDTDVYTRAITFGPSCDADIDGDDGEVNTGDLLVLLAGWGGIGPGADLAEPFQIIDTADLLALLAAWGPCP